jgi:hypothetical protein
MLPLWLCAALPLSACAPATTAPVEPATPAAPADSGGSIRGAIRNGNRPPPALRVCAHPVAGGAPICTDAPAGASEYRIGVAPGRYFLMGWVQDGELRLIAHAEQIRCIRAPCPPDQLIVVEVAAGEDRGGIDLTGGYVDVPEGWPAKP